MNRFNSVLCSLAFAVMGCTAEDNVLKFSDFVNLQGIEKATMHNNYGAFELSKDQIELLKTQLASLEYVPGFSAKVGAKSVELEIAGKRHTISTATHGDFIEVSKDLITKNKDKAENIGWLYFHSNSINFDNFKKQ